MKYRKPILIGAVFLIFFTFVFLAICGVETSVRHSAVQSALSHLPVLIEGYRTDKGAYPASLDDLIAAEANPENKHLLDLILHDQWKDRYVIQEDTNGFIISAIMPSGLFVKAEQLEKRNKAGEALTTPDRKQ
jgi:type II secretory pathway pseudopilin PulG